MNLIAILIVESHDKIPNLNYQNFKPYDTGCVEASD